VRTYAAMQREKAQAAQTARPKVPKRRLGADCSAKDLIGDMHIAALGITNFGRHRLRSPRMIDMD
jgi:hypothetical protein